MRYKENRNQNANFKNMKPFKTINKIPKTDCVGGAVQRLYYNRDGYTYYTYYWHMELPFHHMQYVSAIGCTRKRLKSSTNYPTWKIFSMRSIDSHKTNY